MPKPRTMIEAWREMQDTWEQQKSEPDYYFDTPLPLTAQYGSTDMPEHLGNSLGDLAPQGLR